jgi:hypothetical protein
MDNLGAENSQNPIQIEPPSTPTYQYTSGPASGFTIRSSPPINRDIDIDNSLSLPNTTIFDPKLDISGLNSIFSSDPLNTTSNNTTGPGRMTYRLPKRANTFTPSRPNKNIRFSTPELTTDTTPDLASAKILQARDLLIEAYSATKSREKQSQILDLIEIFREYTESGKLQKVTNQLASQVNNLEYATRKIEAKTKAVSTTNSTNISILKNPSNQTNSTNSTTTSTTPANSTANSPSGPTFASIALAGANSTPGNWTTIKKAPKKTKVQNRLILIRESETPFSALALRNAINKAFLDKSIKGPVVSSITTTSNKKNLVVTSTSSFTSDFLIEKRAIWEHLIIFKSMIKDEPWYKVVLHGIPTLDFNTPYGMELVLDELKTFNSNLNLKPISTPYWLSSAENRAIKRGGSVVVSFATEAEAERYIRNRVWIAGISIRAEKLLTTSRSTQCTNCQGFGYLAKFCRKGAKYSLCSEPHATQQYHCSVCKQNGQKYSHLAPKCTNCKNNHTSTSKEYEIYKATKGTRV